MTSPVVWFDIPTVELERAIRFYSAVLDMPIKKQQFPGGAIGLFPYREGDVGGCLFESADAPCHNGPLLYLNCAGRLDEAIAAVELHGGDVVTPKQPIGAYGFRAIVLDSEGNRIALHSA